MYIIKPNFSLRYYPCLLAFTILAFIFQDGIAQDGKNPEFPHGKDSLYLTVEEDNSLYIPLTPGSRLAERYFPMTREMSESAVEDNAIPLANGSHNRMLKIKRQQISQNPDSFGLESFPLLYRVRKGETVFRIARIYFDMPILTLMDINQLDSTALSIDQPLLIGYFHVRSKESQSGYSRNEPGYLRLEESESTGTNAENQKRSESTGVAFWDKNQHLSGGLLAMHPTARINSYIEIVNPMFNSTVMAKVIGHIPPQRYPKDISIIVSPEVAQKLGALDTRFRVIMRYVE